MGFINLGRLNIRKRNLCASALVSLSDVQPPEVYKSHILNGPINKLFLLLLFAKHIFMLVKKNLKNLWVLIFTWEWNCVNVTRRQNCLLWLIRNVFPWISAQNAVWHMREIMVIVMFRINGVQWRDKNILPSTMLQ